jgi:GTP-dependent phosphoenolpyruvate carboxykinase
MNSAVRAWVSDVAAMTTPSAVVYCDGSAAERDRLWPNAWHPGS